MERVVYEKYLSDKDDLYSREKKWFVGLSTTDRLLGAEIVGVRFKKEEDDLNDAQEIIESCELTIELSNGSEIEIYFDSDGDINIQSD